MAITTGKNDTTRATRAARRDDSDAAPPQPLPKGFALVYAALLVSMLLSALDQTIVSTALPTIVGELDGVALMAWPLTRVHPRRDDRDARLRQARRHDRAEMGVRRRDRHLRDRLARGRLGRHDGHPHRRTRHPGCRRRRPHDRLAGDHRRSGPARQRAKYTAPIGAVFGLASVVGPLAGGWFTDKPRLALGVLDQHPARRDRADRRPRRPEAAPQARQGLDRLPRHHHDGRRGHRDRAVRQLGRCRLRVGRPDHHRPDRARGCGLGVLLRRRGEGEGADHPPQHAAQQDLRGRHAARDDRRRHRHVRDHRLHAHLPPDGVRTDRHRVRAPADPHGRGHVW